METWPKDKKIILFDGVCNLCDATIQRIIKADKNDLFRFAALDSEIGSAILDHIGIDRTKTDSIVLYEPGQAYYIKAKAALQIASYLGGAYSLLSILQIFPTFILDKGYAYIAQNRYKWYGKKEQCMVPTAEIKAKFL